MTGTERVTYRSVLSNREFAAIVCSQSLSVIGDQLARIAVAILVFQRTGSGLAASATFAISYLSYLVGGPFLSALSDRYPRLTVMVICDLLRAPVILALCLAGLPLWAIFACLGVAGLLAPPFDSARSAMQPDILQGEAYITGNAVINVVLQLGQVVGFALGGALVAAVSVRATLGLDAATFVLSAGILVAFVQRRLPAQPPDGRGSLLRDTADGVRLVRHSPDLRRYLWFSLIGSAALITPEGLAVPVAHGLGVGALAAGIMTASVSAGFVVGGLLVVRLPAARRDELLFSLSILAMAPLLLTPLAASVGTLVALWTLAGLGASLNLVASAAYVQACPAEFRARAYGVAVTLLFSTQGIALLLSGLLADWTSPKMAVAMVAAAMLLALTLIPGLRQPRQSLQPQGSGDLVRGNRG